MSPHSTFVLDPEGFRRCRELLAAEGLRLVEERRESFRLFDNSPETNCTYGQVRSARGNFPCLLRSSADYQHLVVTVTGQSDVAILEDVERALVGHLIEPRPALTLLRAAKHLLQRFRDLLRSLSPS